MGIVTFVGEEGAGARQADQGVISLAIGGFSGSQVEGERSSEGQRVKLAGEPAPRAAKSASMTPPFPPAAETWARTVVLSMLYWLLSAIISAIVNTTVSQTPGLTPSSKAMNSP